LKRQRIGGIWAGNCILEMNSKLINKLKEAGWIGMLRQLTKRYNKLSVPTKHQTIKQCSEHTKKSGTALGTLVFFHDGEHMGGAELKV